PDSAKSIIAEKLASELFPNDQGTPGILVFHNDSGEIMQNEVQQIIDGIIAAEIEGIETIINPAQLPPPAIAGFISEDKSTMIVPMNLKAGLGNKDYSEINDQATEVGTGIAKQLTSTDFYITGPAGIAGDTVKL